jgi:hypothetical protein
VHRDVEHEENDVTNGPSDATEQRSQLSSDVANEAELIQLAAQCKEDCEPDEGDEGTSLASSRSKNAASAFSKYRPKNR